MPGIHKNNTISFRPDEWERVLIEERAYLSGMAKKDFIARSCIYSNICVVGNKDNIQRIVNAVEEMVFSLNAIASSLTTGDFPLSDESFHEMRLRYYAMCLSLVDILDGASYLFPDKTKPSSVLSKADRIEQLLESLKRECQDGDIDIDMGYFGDKKNDSP